MSLRESSGTTIVDSLIHHAASRPNDVAVYDVAEGGRRRELTWSEVCSSAQRLAQILVRDFEGCSVIIAVPNSAEAQVALLGSLWSGSKVMPMSPELPVEGFRGFGKKLGKCVLIAGKEKIDVIGGLFEGSLLAENCLTDSALRHISPSADLRDRSRQASILLESSGTTGLPKIAQREMQSLVAMGHNLSSVLQLTSGDRMLVSILLCHSYGIDLALLAAVVSGCAIEIHRRYSPSSTRVALAEGRITVWPGVPLMFDSVSRTGNTSIRHGLRLATSAGSPLSERIYNQFLQVFKLPIGQIYGATEFGSVFYGSPEMPSFDPAAVGQPLEGVEARVIDIERPDINHPLANGNEGEIAISAPTMLAGYLEGGGGPDRKGFLRTGDVGYIDVNGVLRITGRVKLMIDIGARKVNPLEIEALLVKHSTVAEAVVVAVPYSDSADRHKALVLGRDGQLPDPEELCAYLQKHLISYKVPRNIEVRQVFPRSSMGKVLRRLLQAEASGEEG